MRASAMIILVGVTTSDVGLADQLIPTPNDWIANVVGGSVSEPPKLDLRPPLELHPTYAAEAASSSCLTHPGTPSATGYWMYHIEHPSGRHCWYVSAVRVVHVRAGASLMPKKNLVVDDDVAPPTDKTPAEPVTTPSPVVVVDVPMFVVPRINDPFVDIKPDQWVFNTDTIHVEAEPQPIKVHQQPLPVSDALNNGEVGGVHDTAVWNNGQFWSTLIVIQLMVFYVINWFIGKLNVRKLVP